MDRIFNMDNPFFTAMSRIADLFILNMVFLLCCIPLVTIGPALTALFYVTLKMARNDESYIIRSFFRSFRQNLKQGILIHLILAAIAGVFLGDFLIIRQITASYASVYMIFLMAMILIYAFVYLYIYPILSRFDNSIRHTFQNALLMSIRHLPQTLLMLIISAIPVAILFLQEARLQAFLLFALILIGPSGIALLNSLVFVRIFDKYVPAEPPVTDDDFDPNMMFAEEPDAQQDKNPEE